MSANLIKVKQIQNTTTVGDPGVDTLFPTEKAVRDALDAVPGGGDVSQDGAVTPGNLAVWSDDYKIEDGGAVPVGGGATPHEQGNMINGKIVVSVASDNLTVALKNLAGNDPSAGDPVLVRIGDTVRTLTAALSVTKNAGTNWCNAGSSELATKEIDYFVYLGYNATDGVVIGFSRIPYGLIYSDFSTTTTNEKYCGISTIANAAAGDCYENIGRFAATLSAGAGYTWTVPTFTNANLIQRPMFESRWLTWQPVYSASGSMTYTSVTTTTARYMIRGNYVSILIYVTGTTGGTASGTIKATTPFTSAYNTYTGTSFYQTGMSNWNIAQFQVSTGGYCATVKGDATDMGLAADTRLVGTSFFAI